MMGFLNGHLDLVTREWIKYSSNNELLNSHFGNFWGGVVCFGR